MDLLSICGLIVGILALIQAYIYNRSANQLNERTVQMQKYVENMINHSNLLNMYTFLGVREILGNDKNSDGTIQKLSLTKDTVVFIKGLDYAVQNSDSCKEIIFQSGVMKPKVYGEKVLDFLNSDEKTLKITLKSEISKSSIEDFMSMFSSLLTYDISVLHNIHF